VHFVSVQQDMEFPTYSHSAVSNTLFVSSFRPVFQSEILAQYKSLTYILKRQRLQLKARTLRIGYPIHLYLANMWQSTERNRDFTTC